MSLKPNKTKELINVNFKDYTEIHSHLAQAVVQQVCDEYNYYFKALKEYFIEHNNKSNNRDMYNFPHARFIEILKYKGLLKDIVVIEVEESYTSKTSFIDNEILRVFNKDKNKELIECEKKDLTQGKENQLSNSNNNVKNSKVKMLGKRVDRKFISKDKVIIHAEVNGSFNIVRKLLLKFSYDSKIINIEYELMELNNHSKKKLTNFYERSLMKKEKLKEIKCELSGVALSV